MKRAFMLTVLSLVTIAVLGQNLPVPDLPAAPSVAAVNLPTIYDSNGKSLGNLVNTEQNDRYGVVLFKLVDVVDGNVMLRIARQKDGSIGWKVGPLFFESDDCTGNAFTVTGGTLSDYIAAVDKDGIMHTGLVSDAVWTNSRSFYDPEYNDGQCVGGGVSMMMVPLKSQTDLKTIFAPPFGVGGLPRIKAAKH